MSMSIVRCFNNVQTLERNVTANLLWITETLVNAARKSVTENIS